MKIPKATVDQLLYGVLDSAKWLRSEEANEVDSAQQFEVATELAECAQVLDERILAGELPARWAPVVERRKPRYRVKRCGAYVEGDAEKIDRALDLLRDARDLFEDAGATITAARTRQCISSARGAVRNAGYRKNAKARGR